MSTTNPQDGYTLLQNTLINIYDEVFPVKEIKQGYKNKLLWLSVALKNGIKKKNKLYIKYRKHPTAESQNKYKQYKCVLNKALKAAERKYFEEMFTENKNNLSKSWKILKGILNHGKDSNIPEIFNHDGRILTSKKDIANQFNNFFVKIGPTLADDIPEVNRKGT